MGIDLNEVPILTIFDGINNVIQSLVIASISDIQRPAEKLSPSQIGLTFSRLFKILCKTDAIVCLAALAATGVIWSRYSLVITPKNWSLFSVNAFVATSNLYQLYRIFKYRRSLRDNTKVQN